MTWSLDRTVDTCAGRVAYGMAGSGEPLVLAHGWPWSSFAWHRVIPDLAKRFHVHWYDMPGYGRSEMSADQRTSLDVQGEVFVEMLRHWDLDRPAVMAHDFGGAVALRAHLLHGAAFKSCLLMNVVALRPWGSAFFDHVARNVEVFAALPPHIHEAIVCAYIKGALVNAISETDLSGLIDPWLSKAGASSFYRQFAQADERYTAEFEPLLGEMRCPIRIVWGEHDPWIPLERGQMLHRLMPRSGFTQLPMAGHLPQLEVPALVLQEAFGFC